MEHIKLAIVTDDGAYGEALSRALLIGNKGFDLSLFSCGGFCSRWEAGGELFTGGYDLILWDQEGVDHLAGGCFVRLTEYRSETGAEEDRPVIYKYDPMEVMTGEIFRIYEAKTGRRPAGSRPSRIDVFAFAGWQGGCGCTSLCMALGQELIRCYQRRVLYLSLEGIESTPLYMETRPGMRGAGEFLYRLHADEHGRPPFLEGYLVKNDAGVEAFAPSAGCNPLSIAAAEEMERLISALMNSGRFDTILIDTGTAMGGAAREALTEADRILLVSSAEEPAREERYWSFLRYGGESDLREKVIRVRNRCPEYGGHTPEAASNDGEVRVAAAQTSVAGIIIEGRFAKDIHRLAEVCYNRIERKTAE